MFSVVFSKDYALHNLFIFDFIFRSNAMQGVLCILTNNKKIMNHCIDCNCATLICGFVLFILGNN